MSYQDTDTLSGAARVFSRHWSPRIILAFLIPSAIVRVVLGGWSPYDLLIPVGLVAIWPIQEWLIHVLVLHFKPFQIRGRTIDLLVAQKHRLHHREPTDLPNVYIPLHIHAVALPWVFVLWGVLMPTPALAFTGITAHFLGTFLYEWTHFLIHTRYRPRSKFYERLWRSHRLHHYKNERYWLGVTMLSGDKLFGTQPPYREVETSETCRTLGVALPVE